MELEFSLQIISDPGVIKHWVGWGEQRETNMWPSRDLQKLSASPSLLEQMLQERMVGDKPRKLLWNIVESHVYLMTSSVAFSCNAMKSHQMFFKKEIF